jgi:hypothetical protein
VGADKNVYVLELATGKERACLRVGQYVLSLVFTPDGERLIGALHDRELCVWDLATGREIARLPGHSVVARSLAVSPDGKTLASGGSEGAVLLWDLGRLPPARPAPRELSAKELEDEWQALGGEGATRAYRALWALTAAPRQALPLLRRHLRPTGAADPERVARLVKDLDSKRFAAREQATAELEKLGGAAFPALRQALDAGPSREVRGRAEKLLQKTRVELLVGDRLRAARMVELLERIGTPEAGQMLRAFAEKETDPWLAREAEAAAARVGQRAGASP